MVEVEEADGGSFSSALRVNGQGHTVGQVLVDQLVAGDAGLADVFEVEDHAVGLVLGHPLVEPHEGRFQTTLQEHVPLVAALRRQFVAGHVCPAESFQQGTRRLFGVVVFV